MNEPVPAFRPPNPVERTFNRALGALVGFGLGPRDYYLLQVRGRKSGRLFSTPVNVIELQGVHKLRVKDILVKMGFPSDRIDVR